MVLKGQFVLVMSLKAGVCLIPGWVGNVLRVISCVRWSVCPWLMRVINDFCLVPVTGFGQKTKILKFEKSFIMVLLKMCCLPVIVGGHTSTAGRVLTEFVGEKYPGLRKQF